MDVKYILLESMSHHMFPGLVASMDWDNLDNMLQEISKFHGDYQREAADLIILAYRHNTYSKVGLSSSLVYISPHEVSHYWEAV